MPPAPPITDIEQLKSHPALGLLVEWNASVVQAVKFDREELTIWVKEKPSAKAAPFCAIPPPAIRLSGQPNLCRLVSLRAAV